MENKTAFMKNMKGALTDIMTKDVSNNYHFANFEINQIFIFQLHFMFENCTVSCHQSIFVPKSKFLKSILDSQSCGAGVQNVTVFLTGVKADTMQR